MTYTEEVLKQILWEDIEGYESVTDENMEDGGRWYNHFDQVFKTPEDMLIRICWTRGSTEYQDEGPENITWSEVVPLEVTRTEYVTQEYKDKHAGVA